MFCFFKNDQIFDFWSNDVGDVFTKATCKSLKWNEAEIDLVYYPFLDSAPSDYNIGPNKELIVLKKIVSQKEEESVNDLGETVINIVDVETVEVDKTIEPIVYFAKGLMIKPC